MAICLVVVILACRVAVVGCREHQYQHTAAGQSTMRVLDMDQRAASIDQRVTIVCVKKYTGPIRGTNRCTHRPKTQCIRWLGMPVLCTGTGLSVHIMMMLTCESACLGSSHMTCRALFRPIDRMWDACLRVQPYGRCASNCKLITSVIQCARAGPYMIAN